MVEKVSELKPPTGISRLLFRAPIWLYDLNLGWIMGNRFLKITHIGRVSGKIGFIGVHIFQIYKRMILRHP